MEHTSFNFKHFITVNFQTITLACLAITVVLLIKQQADIITLSKSLNNIETDISVIKDNPLSTKALDFSDEIDKLSDNIGMLSEKVDSL